MTQDYYYFYCNRQRTIWNAGYIVHAKKLCKLTSGIWCYAAHIYVLIYEVTTTKRYSRVVMLQTVFRRCLVRILAQSSSILNEVFRAFSQSHQADTFQAGTRNSSCHSMLYSRGDHNAARARHEHRLQPVCKRSFSISKKTGLTNNRNELTIGRSRRPFCLRGRSAVAWLLGSQVRTPLKAWVFVPCVVRCVGSCLCDKLITRSES
jgi:hypothetical protein